MDKKIRIGICGYGNLGRGVEIGIKQNKDMELVAVFTRREHLEIKSEVPVVNIKDIENWKDKIDVMILCGGSAKDLPKQSPEMVKLFNIIDSFDTHCDTIKHYTRVDESAKEGGNIGIISVGWDPGLFSINRVIDTSILPEGSTYTFWGKGVSQGHSDAIRQIAGVKNAVQYTIPVEEAMNRIRKGENPTLTTKEKHTRECFVVLEEGADKAEIEQEIKIMPQYFRDYDTIVNFVTEEDLRENHNAMPHGGVVIHSGKTNGVNNQLVEFSVELESNPEFTSNILIAYARAAYRLAEKGEVGARTVFDIPPYMLSMESREELIKNLL